MLDGVLNQNREAVLEPSVEHKEAISTADLAEIKEYFSDVLESGDALKLSQ